MRYPLIIHEQNSIPGTTNKLLSKIASSVLEAFPNSFEKKVNARTVGNPIRNEITSIEQPKERLDGRDFPIRILILGGSQGSLVLNKSVPNSIKEIASIAKLEVLHQAGSKTIKEAQKSYENVPVGLYLVEFIDEIAEAYRWADIVICRAGAMTVSELLAAGLPAIFIPFSLATDDHQTENAKFMKEIGAAEIVSENEIEKGALSLILRDWIQDRAILERRSCLARSNSKSEATNAIVETCLNYVDQNE
jgi:UDP-N-acetylglucosamine--N-acetylmuramyl-(pentapeptide) pyrophosphoryl-undecaprenol N-acetylglucosamine transferase